jgi:hypothetical protein
VSSSAWAYLWTRVDGETGVGSLSSPKFNLSQLKVLRSLEVGGWDSNLRRARHTIVMEVFLTITSPVFSELVIVIGVDAVARLPSEVKLFKTLRTMNHVRVFKLVFLVVDPDSSQEKARRDVGGSFRLGGCEGPSRFSRLPHPPSVANDIAKAIVGHDH